MPTRANHAARLLGGRLKHWRAFAGTFGRNGKRDNDFVVTARSKSPRHGTPQVDGFCLSLACNQSSFSPDKMPQGRLFAYHDAQLYRIGTNHQRLPVNKPRCPMHNFQRDGAMKSVPDEIKLRQIPCPVFSISKKFSDVL